MSRTMAEDDIPRARRGFRAWPTPVKWTTYVAGAVALVLIASLVVGIAVVRRSYPDTSGELDLPGLEHEVEVIRDERGIPQIYGSSMRDLMTAQGFVHAQERFFEMDVRRHATAGRLAELVGESGVDSDAVVRTLGWRRIAERELAMVAPETRDLLDAYAQGVNAYLADREPSQISLEYTLLGVSGLDYTPEEWTPVDSLAWLKAMAWDLRGNLEQEIGRALSIATAGKRRAAQLYPSYPYREHEPVVTQGAVVDDVFEQNALASGSRLPERPPLGPDVVEELTRTADALDAVPPLLGNGDGLGSNAWAVSGERTESGAPILANDPHLGVSLPGVWMQVGLHCREVSAQCPLDVAGFSFSGVPGVVVGRNADIAWGFTDLGQDVTDLFVERIDDEQWLHDGQRRRMRQRMERIVVRDGEDVALTVRSTDHGPIVSDIADHAGLGARAEEVADAEQERHGAEWDYAVSLAWTALEPRPTIDALFALNVATDWPSFRSALSSFAVPGQNAVYADAEGHIGYQATGLVPIRQSGNAGMLPAAGWRSENDWTGQYVAYDAMPNLLDPDSGQVVTANQAVVGREYPYHLTSDWDRGYRSDRIAELLGADEQLGIDDMAAIQLDDQNPMAAVLTPYLLEIGLPDGYYSDGQRLLRDWEYDQPAGSAAAAYYNVVWRELLTRTFQDELPEELWPDGGQRWFGVVTRLLRRPGNAWWDDVETDGRENRDDILAASLRAARDEMTRRQSPNADDWAWGDLHRLELRSTTFGASGVGAMERMFNRGGWAMGGGGSIVNATGWDAAEGYDVTSAPSMRMIVPMDDPDGARWISLTGVSGHAFSEHYTDQTDLIARGETVPWVFTRDAVEAAAEDTLTLNPTD